MYIYIHIHIYIKTKICVKSPSSKDYLAHKFVRISVNFKTSYASNKQTSIMDDAEILMQWLRFWSQQLHPNYGLVDTCFKNYVWSQSSSLLHILWDDLSAMKIRTKCPAIMSIHWAISSTNWLYDMETQHQ